MPSLQPAGYISNNARTEQEVKDELEAMIAVIKQMFSSPHGTEPLTISTGSITPTKSFIIIDTEASAATDDLDTIDQTNLPSGSIVVLRPLVSGRLTTVKNSTGNIECWNNQDQTFAGNQDYMIFLNTSGTWRQLGPPFRDAAVDVRADLGLGTAALANVGPGNGLDADTLDGVQGSGYLLVGAKAADSDLLDGRDASNFVRKDAAAGLQIQENQVRFDNAKIIIRDDVGVNPRIDFQANSVPRMLVQWFSDNVEMSGWNSAGTTRVSGLRARRSDFPPDYWGETDQEWKRLATLLDAEQVPPRKWVCKWGVKALPTTLTTAENVEAAQYQIGVEDGVAGDKWFRIKGAMGLAPAGQGSGWNLGLRITVGPNGNDTDPFIFQSAQIPDWIQNGTYLRIPVYNDLRPMTVDAGTTPTLPQTYWQQWYRSGNANYWHFDPDANEIDAVYFQATVDDYLTFYMRTSAGATGASINSQGFFVVEQLQALTDLS